MRAWQILGLLLILLFLIGQIRVGVNAALSQEGMSIRVRLGLFKIKVFPRPEKERKAKKPKKTKKRTGKRAATKAMEFSVPESSQTTGFDTAEDGTLLQAQPSKTQQRVGKPLKEKMESGLELARRFVPLALEAAGCFYRKLVMDELELCLTVGGSDPADTAMLYGQANAALAALWDPLNKAFHVKDGHAQVRIDFDSPKTTLYGKAALSLKIGQILWLGVYFGIRALVRFLGYRNITKAKQKDRKAV